MSRAHEVNEGMSLADITRGMFARKLLIAVPTLVALVLAAVFLLINSPRYIAESQVVIENQYTPFDKTVGPQDGSAGGYQVNDHMVSSQVSAMRSEDIAARVVDQLDLGNNPEYNANLRSHGVFGGLAIALGFKDDPALFSPKLLAAKTLASDLTIYPIPETNVIGIKSTAGEPAIAAAAANAVAETYVLTTREVGANGTDRAREWLAKQIEALRSKVGETDQAVERYRTDAGLIRGTTTTLGTQQISELNTQIGIAENARVEAITKLNVAQRMIKDRGDANAVAEVLASPSLQRLKDEQVSAARDISQASATYLPGHPKMIAAQHHLDAVNNQIRVESQRVIDSLQSQAQVADQRAQSLRGELEKMKASQSQAGFSDVRLQALQRDAAANRTLLQSMLGRYADANARQDTSMQPGFARIIQRAVAPAAPYFPKKGPTLVLATVAGLLLGLGLAFVMEILSQPTLAASTNAVGREPQEIHDTENYQPVMPRFELPAHEPAEPPTVRTTAAPTLKPSAPLYSIFGTLPAAANAVAAIAMLEEARTGETVGLGEDCAKLAGRFDALAQEHGMKVFALASVGAQPPNAAMSAIATGRALAAKGKRIMLLDLTTRASSAEYLLGLGAGPGLTDLVEGKADFTKSVTRDSGSKMHFVRLGALNNQKQEEAIVARLPAILTALRMVYDITIINLGEARASVVQVLANADATVLLASQSRLGEAFSAAKALEEAGTTKTMLIQLVLGSAANQQIKASA